MTGFLAPLADHPRRPHVLRNLRTGKIVASHLEAAFNPGVRRKGLLGRSSLAAGTALILAPCRAVHTCFMRFPIDIAFVSRSGRVRKVCRNVAPWRLAGSLRAYAVIELAAGALDRSDTQPLDSLAAEPSEPADRI